MSHRLSLNGGRGRTEDDALGGLTNAAPLHVAKKGPSDRSPAPCHALAAGGA